MIIILRPTKVFLAKSDKRGSVSRDGYVDSGNQVFLPPKANVTVWKDKMKSLGYQFRE